MKGYLLLIVLVVLIILVLLAWRKETLPETAWKGRKEDDATPLFAFKPPSKAKKSRASNSKEEKWRDVFEQITGHAYPTVRPFWLVNPETGRCLELDGYCAELGSAFEYNGRQHYEFPNSFHKTRDEFEQQVARDTHKMRICRDMGVDLVVIPYDLTIEEAYEDIRKHLQKVMAQRRKKPL